MHQDHCCLALSRERRGVAETELQCRAHATAYGIPHTFTHGAPWLISNATPGSLICTLALPSHHTRQKVSRLHLQMRIASTLAGIVSKKHFDVCRFCAHPRNLNLFALALCSCTPSLWMVHQRTSADRKSWPSCSRNSHGTRTPSRLTSVER